MDNKLKIEETGRSCGVADVMVSGFSEEDLEALNKMSDAEAKDAILDMLDRRNGNTGSCWRRGYGIYGFRKNGDRSGTYLFRIGTSCD